MEVESNEPTRAPPDLRETSWRRNGETHWGAGIQGEESINFPEDFLWGTAMVVYQVEGAVHEDVRGLSIWDTFSHTPGKVLHGDTGDIACEQYHHLEDDLDLMASLGIKAYRFSVAWRGYSLKGAVS